MQLHSSTFFFYLRVYLNGKDFNLTSPFLCLIFYLKCLPILMSLMSLFNGSNCCCHTNYNKCAHIFFKTLSEMRHKFDKAVMCFQSYRTVVGCNLVAEITAILKKKLHVKGFLSTPFSMQTGCYPVTNWLKVAQYGVVRCIFKKKRWSWREIICSVPRCNIIQCAYHTINIVQSFCPNIFLAIFLYFENANDSYDYSRHTYWLASLDERWTERATYLLWPKTL